MTTETQKEPTTALSWLKKFFADIKLAWWARGALSAWGLCGLLDQLGWDHVLKIAHALGQNWNWAFRIAADWLNFHFPVYVSTGELTALSIVTLGFSAAVPNAVADYVRKGWWSRALAVALVALSLGFVLGCLFIDETIPQPVTGWIIPLSFIGVTGILGLSSALRLVEEARARERAREKLLQAARLQRRQSAVNEHPSSITQKLASILWKRTVESAVWLLTIGIYIIGLGIAVVLLFTMPAVLFTLLFAAIASFVLWGTARPYFKALFTCITFIVTLEAVLFASTFDPFFESIFKSIPQPV